jgi:MerR family transcriptional regulator, copper efflux regulator
MNLRELASLTGTPERQIRYMIAEGFVPPPVGGRAYADYGDDHVAAILRYLSLRNEGFPPQAIRVLLSGGDMAPFPVAPGITLHVAPEILGNPMDVDALMGRINTRVRAIFKEPTDADHVKAHRKRPR